jgi:hypothetical protein
VLAARAGKSGPLAAWLEQLDIGPGCSLALPSGEERKTNALHEIRIPGMKRRLECRIWHLPEPEEPLQEPGRAESPVAFAAPHAGPADPRPPYRIRPSEASSDWPDLPPMRVVDDVALPGPAPTLPRGQDAADLGNAVHDFLCADVDLDRDARVALARGQLECRGLSAIAPGSLLAISDSLRAFIDSRWPRAVWHREQPVRAFVESAHGRRRLEGSIDLLLELDRGWVVIDHKTTEAKGDLHPKAVAYGPQLAAYGRALEAATGQKPVGYFVHFAMAGRMVQLDV